MIIYYIRVYAKNYYASSHWIIIVYDITDQESFGEVEGFIKKSRQFTSPWTPILICGNKLDLSSSRVVSFENGIDLATKYDWAFIEASAKDNINILTLFSLVSGILLPIDTQ